MSPPIRLGIVTSGFPYTVKEAFLQPELEALSTAGAALCVYPTNPVLERPHFACCFDHRRVALFSIDVLAEAFREFAAQPAAVMRALRAIACRGSWRARIKNVSVFCKSLAVARDMRRRRVEHVHAYWASTPATIAYIVSLLNRIPWSFTAHRWDINEDNLLADKVRHAQFVRAISRRARAAVLERTLGGALKVRVLHLGVVTGRAVATDVLGRPCTLICAANLEPVKGHWFLIEALRQVIARGIPVRCVLAGDGSKRAPIAASIAASGLTQFVTLAGNVPHERLMAELSGGAYDIAVLASVEDGGLHEGIPVFLMEAMASGVACIATRTGSVEELIDENVGMLVQQKNSSMLARAIELLSGDVSLRRKLGSAARERVAERFCASRLASELLDWIQKDDSEPMREAISETTLARS